MTDRQNTFNVLDKFKSVFKVSNSIFKNRALLTDAYIPDMIIARDSQIGEIASNLQPIIDNEPSAPINMFLTGENGSGKTSTTAYVVNLLNAGIEALGQDISVDYIKINCAIRTTDTEVCRELFNFFGITDNPVGISTSFAMQKVWDRINERAKQTVNYAVLFFFDEVDKLNSNYKKSKENEIVQLDILYQISRAIECGLIKSTNCNIGLITASNKPHFLANVENSITTSAGFSTLTFPNYTEQDLFLILMDRINAFQPGAITETLIRYIAKDIADRYRGDARRALDTLLIAGKYALDAGTSYITLDHIHAAEVKISLLANDKLLADFSRHDVLLLLSIDILSKQTDTNGKPINPNTGLIYNIYVWLCKLLGDKFTTLETNSKTLIKMADNGILFSERGNRGNTRIYTLTDDMRKVLQIKYTMTLQELVDKKYIDELCESYRVKPTATLRELLVKTECDLDLLIQEKIKTKKKVNKQQSGFSRYE